MPIMSPVPPTNPNTGKNRGGAPGKVLAQGISQHNTKDHLGSDATYANRKMMGEDSFSPLQSLVDCIFGLKNFMVGIGQAGLDVEFEGNHFQFGGFSNNPLGFVGHSPSGASSSPGSIAGISPPNTMKGVTSSGPSGGVTK